MRRRVLGIVGSGSPLSPATTELCRALGRLAVDAGFRLVTGGMGGVMKAISAGAHEAASYREGDVIGILKGYDAQDANPHVDIAIPTGMGIARNVIVVASSDVVVGVGGGAGTLSELAYAWQLGKPVVALRPPGGWAERLAGSAIDDRRDDEVQTADTAAEAVAAAKAFALP